MLNYISADKIYPVLGKPIPNGVIGVDNKGTICAVLTESEALQQGIKNIERHKGVLIPGFVNTHCHLELSHLRGAIKERTGLTEFIRGILSLRDQPETQAIKAMQAADEEMYANGIVAVGDISNKLISKEIKLKSKIYYHTFVEVFGFNAPAEKTIAGGIDLRDQFEPLRASIVPHAPYSVSPALFHKIAEVTRSNDVLSIHNQETAAENELFEKGTGKFADFFAEMGIALNEAHGAGQNAIRYHLPRLPERINLLLVHNTFAGKNDIRFAENEHHRLYWCLCPNANLYIENSLPDSKEFLTENIKITLGTDSLASNHQLSILAEMRTLQDHQFVSFERSLPWATLNGAESLGIAQTFGSLTVGKKPGILLVDLGDDGKIKENSMVKRLF